MQKSGVCPMIVLTGAILITAGIALPATHASVVFVRQPPFSTGLSGPRSVAVADLEGDGDTDVVVANETTDSIAVLRNDGTGTLTLVGVPLPVGDRPVSVLLSDLNGDNQPDLATAERGDDTLTMLLNTSSSTTISFTESAHSPVSVPNGPAFLTADHFDGAANNRRDLAVVNLDDHTISVLVQQADGSFVAEDPFPLQSNDRCCLFPNTLARGDLNGDGAIDLVAASVGRPSTGLVDRVRIWLNSGTNPPFSDYLYGPDTILTIPLLDSSMADPACDHGAPSPQEDCHTISVRVARLNADSSLDIVVVNEFTGMVSVLFNNGEPANLAFTRVDVSAGHNAPVFLAVADLERDGDNDLIVVNKGSNDLSILFNHGNGTFTPPHHFPVGTSPVAVAVADLNDDGSRDLVVANNGANTVSVLLNRPLHHTVAASGDFNRDGFKDLAIGAPAADVAGRPAAGTVHIVYGSVTGLRTAGAQWFHQNSAGIPDAVEQFDRFGSALAVGDFNGDGFRDLAIGVPGEDVGNRRDAGMIHIVYGAATGLSVTGDQVFHQERAGMLGIATAFDQFGYALAVGNFNHDAFTDLAIGVPGKRVGTALSAGAVHIMYGSATGLTASNDQLLHQNTAGFLGVAQPFDRFGSALASGKLNGDVFPDLAIGVPGKRVGAALSAGAVHIVYGSATGLTSTGNQLIHQNTPGLLGSAVAFDYFGSALTSGKLNGDAFLDLAIGVPGKHVSTRMDAGMVHVVYGSPTGISATGNQIFHQNSANIPGEAAAGDAFGSALAAGNFDGDAFTDLAIGVPGDRIQTHPHAGTLHLLYGTATGLATLGNQMLHQNRPGITDVAEQFDRFGCTLSVGDFNNDSFTDLVVGIPGEQTGATAAGAVHVLDGGGDGPSNIGDQVFRLTNEGTVTVTGN